MPPLQVDQAASQALSMFTELAKSGRYANRVQWKTKDIIEEIEGIKAFLITFHEAKQS